MIKMEKSEKENNIDEYESLYNRLFDFFNGELTIDNEDLLEKSAKQIDITNVDGLFVIIDQKKDFFYWEFDNNPEAYELIKEKPEILNKLDAFSIVIYDLCKKHNILNKCKDSMALLQIMEIIRLYHYSGIKRTDTFKIVADRFYIDGPITPDAVRDKCTRQFGRKIKGKAFTMEKFKYLLKDDTLYLKIYLIMAFPTKILEILDLFSDLNL